MSSKTNAQANSQTSKKRKVGTAVAAITVAVAILLTGTFAWTSISQTALNETAGIPNPGARLHDDFNGENKDVYVENFTSADDGGLPIYARVRLDEYMEIGKGAGSADTTVNNAKSLVDGATLNDKTTWTTHIPEATDDPFHTYWDFTTGGQTTYMPTFNKNKDSKAADINGTYLGTSADDDVHYDDYVTYADGETKTGQAVYDADDDNDVEEETPVEGTNIKTVAETHTAAKTLNAAVMTMQEWLDNGSPTGEFWVYDTDGWAYWAQAILPGQATGLLLDGIEMKATPSEAWYYAINVVGQFITADEFVYDAATPANNLFAQVGSDKYSIETAGATAIYNAILKQETTSVSVTPATASVAPGGTASFTAAPVGITNITPVADDVKFSWAVTGGNSTDTKIDASGNLSVGADETATELTVTATPKYKTEISGEATVAVEAPEATAATEAPEATAATEAPTVASSLAEDVAKITAGSADTVTVEDEEYYVLAKESDRALILLKKTFEAKAFDDSDNRWMNSEMRTYLNGEWLSARSTLSSVALTTTLYTLDETDSATFDTTQDKVFLLSEADVFGTSNGTAVSDSKYYTYNGAQLPAPGEGKNWGNLSGDWYWLRSPRGSNTEVANVLEGGTDWYTDSYNSGGGVRPALWVDLTA